MGTAILERDPREEVVAWGLLCGRLRAALRAAPAPGAADHDAAWWRRNKDVAARAAEHAEEGLCELLLALDERGTTALEPPAPRPARSVPGGTTQPSSNFSMRYRNA